MSQENGRSPKKILKTRRDGVEQHYWTLSDLAAVDNSEVSKNTLDRQRPTDSRKKGSSKAVTDTRREKTLSGDEESLVQKLYRWTAGTLSTLAMTEEQKKNYLEHRKHLDRLVDELRQVDPNDPRRSELELEVIAAGVQIIHDVSGAIIKNGWKIITAINKLSVSYGGPDWELSDMTTQKEMATKITRELLTSIAAGININQGQREQNGHEVAEKTLVNREKIQSKLPETDVFDDFWNSSDLSGAFDDAFSALEELLTTTEGKQIFDNAAVSFDEVLKQTDFPIFQD